MTINTPPNRVLMLFFWKGFVFRKWHKMHQNEGFLPVFDPRKSLFLMNSVPFLRFGIIGTEGFVILYVIDLLIIK